MRVTWVTFGEPIYRPDGSLSFAAASARYRVLAPIQAMGDEGHENKVVVISPTRVAPPDEEILDTDLLVFSKSFSPSNEALARRAQGRRVRVIFDVCDNHYDDPQFGAHYRALSELADQVVCNTAEMARVAAPYCARPPLVIEDPYEGPRGEPRYAPGERLNLLWYGYDTNLDSFQAALPDLLEYSDLRQAISLILLTQVSEELESWCRRGTAKFGRHFSMTPKPWSQEAQWGYLKACDAVIIPSLDNPSKQVKSANRIVEALWAGRPAVAQPLPAYQPFAQWTPVTQKLSDGLAWLSGHVAEVPARLANAQVYITREHDPARIGRRWEAALAATLAQPAGPS